MNMLLLTYNSYELSYLRCFTRQTFRGSNTQEDKPYPPHVLYTFIRRYNRGDIDTSFYQEYINHKPLQDQLYGYKIAPDPFFYFILFQKDFINTLTQKIHNSALDDLFEIANLINQSTQAHITLTTTINGKQHNKTFTNPPLLKLLEKLPQFLLQHELELVDKLKQQIPEITGQILIEDETPIKEKITLKQYIFYETLRQFLNLFQPCYDKTPDDTVISHDKDLIISRCTGLIELINNPSDKQKYLKPKPETTYNKNKRNPLLDNISSLRQNPPLIKLYSPIYDHAIIDGGKDRIVVSIPHKPKSHPEQ